MPCARTETKREEIAPMRPLARMIALRSRTHRPLLVRRPMATVQDGTDGPLLTVIKQRYRADGWHHQRVQTITMGSLPHRREARAPTEPPIGNGANTKR